MEANHRYRVPKPSRERNRGAEDLSRTLSGSQPRTAAWRVIVGLSRTVPESDRLTRWFQIWLVAIWRGRHVRIKNDRGQTTVVLNWLETVVCPLIARPVHHVVRLRSLRRWCRLAWLADPEEGEAYASVGRAVSSTPMIAAMLRWRHLDFLSFTKCRKTRVGPNGSTPRMNFVGIGQGQTTILRELGYARRLGRLRGLESHVSGMAMVGIWSGRTSEMPRRPRITLPGLPLHVIPDRSLAGNPGDCCAPSPVRSHGEHRRAFRNRWERVS